MEEGEGKEKGTSWKWKKRDAAVKVGMTLEEAVGEDE